MIFFAFCLIFWKNEVQMGCFQESTDIPRYINQKIFFLESIFKTCLRQKVYVHLLKRFTYNHNLYALGFCCTFSVNIITLFNQY